MSLLQRESATVLWGKMTCAEKCLLLSCREKLVTATEKGLSLLQREVSRFDTKRVSHCTTRKDKDAEKHLSLCYTLRSFIATEEGLTIAEEVLTLCYREWFVTYAEEGLSSCCSNGAVTVRIIIIMSIYTVPCLRSS